MNNYNENSEIGNPIEHATFKCVGRDSLNKQTEKWSCHNDKTL